MSLIDKSMQSKLRVANDQIAELEQELATGGAHGAKTASKLSKWIIKYQNLKLENQRLEEKLATAHKWDEAEHREYSKLKKENQWLEEQVRVRGERMAELYRGVQTCRPYAVYAHWFDDNGHCL